MDAYQAYPEHKEIKFVYDDVDYSTNLLAGLELDSSWLLTHKWLSQDWETANKSLFTPTKLTKHYRKSISFMRRMAGDRNLMTAFLGRAVVYEHCAIKDAGADYSNDTVRDALTKANDDAKTNTITDKFPIVPEPVVDLFAIEAKDI